MHFGFTLKPEHTVERTLAITRQAEAAGFEYGWLFDSHVLWRDPYPLLTLMAGVTDRLQTRDLCDEPGHPRTHRHRLSARHARRDLGRTDGSRHRPRRLGPAGPRQAADHDGEHRGGDPRHQDARRRRHGRIRGHRAPLPVDERLDAPGLGRRLRTDGARDDRPRRRRPDPPACRSRPDPLVRRPGARGRDGGRPRPSLDPGTGRRAGPRRRRRVVSRADTLVSGPREQPRGRSRQQVPARPAPRLADRLRPGPLRATTTTTTPKSAHRTPPSSATRSRTGSASWARSTTTSRSCASSRMPASTSSTST